MYNYDERQRKIALPCVRIRAGRAGGSGTVIYSKDGSSYVLTNHHVVDGCIKLEDKWSPLLKRMKKDDVFEVVDVHFFNYRWESRAIGGATIQSDIMAYDKEEDLALLKLRVDEQKPVADLYPRGNENELRIGMKVIAVGAGLGEPPVQTEGILNQFGREIDRREFWLNSAPSIYGNSGGALFLKESHQLIGVPARIAVTGGFLGGADAITHLSYAIPITRVYDFLETQKFRFIYDDEHTEESEAATRREIREHEERKLAAKDS